MAIILNQSIDRDQLNKYVQEDPLTKKYFYFFFIISIKVYMSDSFY